MDAATIYHQAKKRVPRRRHQRGSIIEKSGSFYVVYRITVDGERKQVWHFLCEKNRETGHGTKSAPAVRELAEDHMREVNNTDGVVKQAKTIVDFWDDTYLPFIEGNCKPSTVDGYTQVWTQHLKDHFGTTALEDYKTPMMTNLLTSLAKTYRPRTLKHIKFLASAVFSHAVATGHCSTNPIRDAQVLGKTLPDGKTGVYTQEEIENVISALVDRVDCQLIMALAYFGGLRKGEIQGLQWGDIDNDYIHIRRSKVKGEVTTPKTKKSVRSIPIIQPVRGLLKLWRDKSTEKVWVFPQDLVNTGRRVIRPALEKAGAPWKAFHSGRRGLGTVLRELTGNSTAGRDVLGHEDEGVTKDHYEGMLPEAALKGMKLLEAKATAK